MGAPPLRSLSLLAAGLLAAGCVGSLPDLSRTLGRTLPPGRPHPELRAEPDRWVLVENPRYQEGDPGAGREPRYVWAERDRLPVTVNRLVGGVGVVLAPPEVQARYAADKGTPPREGSAE